MAKNPLAELLGRIAFSADRTAADLTIAFRHRGAPGDVRRVSGAEIERVSAHGVALADGTVVPLHRVIEVSAGGRILFSRRGGPSKAVPESPATDEAAPKGAAPGKAAPKGAAPDGER